MKNVTNIAPSGHVIFLELGKYFRKIRCFDLIQFSLQIYVLCGEILYFLHTGYINILLKSAQIKNVHNDLSEVKYDVLS